MVNPIQKLEKYQSLWLWTQYYILSIDIIYQKSISACIPAKSRQMSLCTRMHARTYSHAFQYKHCINKMQILFLRRIKNNITQWIVSNGYSGRRAKVYLYNKSSMLYVYARVCVISRRYFPDQRSRSFDFAISLAVYIIIIIYIYVPT